VRKLHLNPRDFRLPPRRKWNLWPFGILLSAE